MIIDRRKFTEPSSPKLFVDSDSSLTDLEASSNEGSAFAGEKARKENRAKKHYHVRKREIFCSF